MRICWDGWSGECWEASFDYLLQFHDEYQEAFSKTVHRKIPIEEYRFSPDRYMTKTCGKHEDQEVKYSCVNCLKKFCEVCDTRKNCPQGTAICFMQVQCGNRSFEYRVMMVTKLSFDKNLQHIVYSLQCQRGGWEPTGENILGTELSPLICHHNVLILTRHDKVVCSDGTFIYIYHHSYIVNVHL